jgi:hypothetical protein
VITCTEFIDRNGKRYEGGYRRYGCSENDISGTLALPLSSLSSNRLLVWKVLGVIPIEQELGVQKKRKAYMRHPF